MVWFPSSESGDAVEERDVLAKDDLSHKTPPWWTQLDFSSDSSLSSSRSGDSQSQPNVSEKRLKKAHSPIVISPRVDNSLISEDLTFDTIGSTSEQHGGTFGPQNRHTSDAVIRPDEGREPIATQRNFNERDPMADDQRESSRYEPCPAKAFPITPEGGDKNSHAFKDVAVAEDETHDTGPQADDQEATRHSGGVRASALVKSASKAISRRLHLRSLKPHQSKCTTSESALTEKKEKNNELNEKSGNETVLNDAGHGSNNISSRVSHDAHPIQVKYTSRTIGVIPEPPSDLESSSSSAEEQPPCLEENGASNCQKGMANTTISRRLDREALKMKIKSIENDRLKEKARSMPNIESTVEKKSNLSTKLNFVTSRDNEDKVDLGSRSVQSETETLSPLCIKSRSEEMDTSSLVSQTTMGTFTPPCLNKKRSEEIETESVTSQNTMDTKGTFTPPCMQRKNNIAKVVGKGKPSSQNLAVADTFSGDSQEWWDEEGQESFDSKASLPLLPFKCGGSPDYSISLALDSQSFDQYSPDESFSVDTYDSIDLYLSGVSDSTPEKVDSHLLSSNSNLLKSSFDGQNDKAGRLVPTPSQSIRNKNSMSVESQERSDSGVQPTEIQQATHTEGHNSIVVPIDDNCDSISQTSSNKKKSLIPMKASKVLRKAESQVVPRVRVFSKTVSHSVSQRLRRRASKMKARRAARRKRDILIRSGLSVDEELPPIAETSDEYATTSNSSESEMDIDDEGLQDKLLFDIQDKVTGEVELFIM